MTTALMAASLSALWRKETRGPAAQHKENRLTVRSRFTPMDDIGRNLLIGSGIGIEPVPLISSGRAIDVKLSLDGFRFGAAFDKAESLSRRRSQFRVFVPVTDMLRR